MGLRVMSVGSISPADENGYRIRMGFYSDGEKVATDVAVVDSYGPVEILDSYF